MSVGVVVYEKSMSEATPIRLGPLGVVAVEAVRALQELDRKGRARVQAVIKEENGFSRERWTRLVKGVQKESGQTVPEELMLEVREENGETFLEFHPLSEEG